MAIKVLVPRLGEGVEEVTVIKWLKQVGDSVNELEPLLEINTDKVDTEIPAPASGTVLKIVAQEGVPAKVGTVLAFIGTVGEKLEDGKINQPPVTQGASQETRKASQKSITQPVQNSTQSSFISPVVARIASEHGINLSQIRGTGLDRRITKNDVLAFVENQGSVSVAQSTSSQAANKSPAVGDQLIKHSTIRKQIAEHMVISQKTSPHVLTVMEADMSKVFASRAANKEAFAREGVNLTFTAYFISAIVAALKAYPMTNSSWTEEGVLVHKAVNIGMATSLGEDGLIVPVIKNADDLSLLAIANAVNDLADRARAKKLQPEEVRGGTFTLTNHGISGSLFAFPIINQPQCGILGTGAIQKRVLVVDDAIAIRPMVYLSFVFDHRILDGASADWFLMKVKETLENWS
jgi:2-oxoglutarate dehydrogenase E2 component (dihydrolipoamide succinyltransferase)